MAKEKILSVLLILIGLFAFATVNAAQPEDKPEGKPFEELRDDINKLEADIAALREEVLDKGKSKIWEAIYELQNRVGTLENQVSDLTNRVANLENWKTVMEEWKTRIETWRQSVDNQLAELDNRITDEVAKLNDTINAMSTDLNSKIAGLTTRVEDLEDTNTILEKTKQVDGSGSGLDADLLDGLDSTDFARTNGVYQDLNVGYAVNTGNADTVDGKHAGELLSPWTDANGYIYPNNIGSGFRITDSGNLYVPGNIGIGTVNPQEKLTVTGTIESTSGGIKFPDGTVQTTAISNYGGDVYTGIIGEDNSITLSKESIVTLNASTFIERNWETVSASIFGSLYVDGQHKRSAGQGGGSLESFHTLSMNYTAKLSAGKHSFKYTRHLDGAIRYSDYFVIIVQ